MNKMFTRILGAFLTGYAVCFIHPVGKAFAVSEKLDLDTNLEYNAAPMPSTFDVFMRMGVSLIIIALLAYFTTKLLRKNMKVFTKGSSIQVLDQYALSVNKGVYITRIAGKVFALGVTDNSINIISEITDEAVIEELETRAKEREAEPILPPNLIDRLIPGKLRTEFNKETNFSAHIQKQIQKLQSVTENRRKNSREDDVDD